MIFFQFKMHEKGNGLHDGFFVEKTLYISFFCYKGIKNVGWQDFRILRLLIDIIVRLTHLIVSKVLLRVIFVIN